MSKAESDNKMQCVHTALKGILTQHGESQGHYTQPCASHRRKADSHTCMKSAYSDSWSLCEFMDSRAEIWMSLGWVLQDQHWGWRVWTRANRSRSLLWDCVLVMSEAIAIKPHRYCYLSMTWMRTTAIDTGSRQEKPSRCLSKGAHIIWLSNTRWSETYTYVTLYGLSCIYILSNIKQQLILKEMTLKESKERFVGGFEDGKRKEEWYNYCLKKLKNNFKR